MAIRWRGLAPSSLLVLFLPVTKDCLMLSACDRKRTHKQLALDFSAFPSVSQAVTRNLAPSQKTVPSIATIKLADSHPFPPRPTCSLALAACISRS